MLHMARIQPGQRNLDMFAGAVEPAMSAAEVVRVAREAVGCLDAMMAHLPHEEPESVWNDVERSLHRCNVGPMMEKNVSSR